MTGRARAGRAPPPQIYAMRRQEKAAKDVSHIETNAASMHKTPEEAAQDAAAESRAGDASKKPTESTAPSSSATAPTVNSKAPSLRFVRLSVYLCVFACARAFACKICFTDAIACTQETKTTSERLRELKELLEENLITESEYQSHRKCIIATI